MISKTRYFLQDNANYHFILGGKYLINGDIDKAESEFLKSIQ
jgi:hypothetical protein